MPTRYEVSSTGQSAVVNNLQVALKLTEGLSDDQFDQMVEDISLEFIKIEHDCPCPECKMLTICGLIGIASLYTARKERSKDARPSSNS